MGAHSIDYMYIRVHKEIHMRYRYAATSFSKTVNTQTSYVGLGLVVSFGKPGPHTRCSDIHVESRFMLKVPHNDACAAHDASHTQGTETNEPVPSPMESATKL